MMVRLSDSTPGSSDGFWERFRRRTNKLLGRPATVDVGTLSSLLTQLRDKTEEQLRKPLESIVVVSPNLRGLRSEDFNDAIEYAGLKSLMGVFPSRIPDTPAAFAGNGFGLCSNYTRLYECEKEEEEMPLEQVPAIHYTRRALSVTLTPLTKAFSFGDDQSLIDWDAGLDALSSYPDASTYWNAVHNKIQEVPNTATGWGRRPVTKLLVLGESALDPTFLKVLQDALRGIRISDTALIYVATDGPDPFYAAAKGAAEFAKRLQEAPRNCVEPEHCQQNRQDLNWEAQDELWVYLLELASVGSGHFFGRRDPLLELHHHYHSFVLLG